MKRFLLAAVLAFAPLMATAAEAKVIKTFSAHKNENISQKNQFGALLDAQNPEYSYLKGRFETQTLFKDVSVVNWFDGGTCYRQTVEFRYPLNGKQLDGLLVRMFPTSGPIKEGLPNPRTGAASFLLKDGSILEAERHKSKAGLFTRLELVWLPD